MRESLEAAMPFEHIATLPSLIFALALTHLPAGAIV
jgi:hypothetical protein